MLAATIALVMLLLVAGTLIAYMSFFKKEVAAAEAAITKAVELAPQPAPQAPETQAKKA